MRYWKCIGSNEIDMFIVNKIYSTDANGYNYKCEDGFDFQHIPIFDIPFADFKEIKSSETFNVSDLDSISLDIMDLACKAYSSAKDESEKEYILSTFLSIREGLSKIEKFITKDNSEED